MTEDEFKYEPTDPSIGLNIEFPSGTLPVADEAGLRIELSLGDPRSIKFFLATVEVSMAAVKAQEDGYDEASMSALKAALDKHEDTLNNPPEDFLERGVLGLDSPPPTTQRPPPKP